MRRALLAVLTLALLLTAASPASAGPRPRVPWVGTNPYGFLIGDSVTQQATEEWGLGWRSLGKLGWPGASTDMVRGRLDGTRAPDWPDWTVTEPSVEQERVWFRDAGWLVIELGTNDVKYMAASDFAIQVDWYLQQSRGRPVLWLTVNNPPLQAKVDEFNAVLRQAAERYPNLVLLPWERWAHEHADQFVDGVHPAYPSAYTDGMYRLIAAGAPAVDAQHAQPVGYWYWDPSTAGPVVLNGWGAVRQPSPAGQAWVNVRSDYQHVGRYPITWESGDLWAQAAGGRAFSVSLPSAYRGHYLCLDVYDELGQIGALGCRGV
jgi:hypothetical protein